MDLVSQVSLQNSTDPNDKTQVQGTSSVSGDTTQSTVLFLKDDLVKLKGTTYKLLYSLKGGAPQSTSLTVTVKQGAISISPGNIDFGSVAQGNLCLLDHDTFGKLRKGAARVAFLRCTSGASKASSKVAKRVD